MMSIENLSLDKPSFNDANYLLLKNAIAPEICRLLSHYIQFKAKLKPNIRKNDGLPGVHREYGDLFMESLLDQLTEKIEAATGLALWPTLSFYYLYQNGHALTRHKDRSSCQIVAGLCIDADEQYKKDHGNWPLMLNIKGQPTPISVDYGDILIFKGHETEHWREPFPGNWFISAIFAYVEQNGPFCFQKYDQRAQLGQSHIGMLRWTYGVLKNKMKTRSNS